MNKEPVLPERVRHIAGLYTRENSDLFIDDLTSQDLLLLSKHKHWYEKNTNTKDTIEQFCFKF